MPLSRGNNMAGFVRPLPPGGAVHGADMLTKAIAVRREKLLDVPRMHKERLDATSVLG